MWPFGLKKLRKSKSALYLKDEPTVQSRPEPDVSAEQKQALLNKMLVANNGYRVQFSESERLSLKPLTEDEAFARTFKRKAG